MAEPGNRRPRAKREERGGPDRDSAPRPQRAGPPSAGELVRLADELEEYGRALIARAGELRQGSGAAGARRETRSASQPRSVRRERERSDRPRERSGERGGERPKRGRGEAPDWAPPPKRRRP